MTAINVATVVTIIVVTVIIMIGIAFSSLFSKFRGENTSLSLAVWNPDRNCLERHLL